MEIQTLIARFYEIIGCQGTMHSGQVSDLSIRINKKKRFLYFFGHFSVSGSLLGFSENQGISPIAKITIAVSIFLKIAIAIAIPIPILIRKKDRRSRSRQWNDDRRSFCILKFFNFALFLFIIDVNKLISNKFS